jgi:two-component system response regulator RegX3
MKVMVKILIIEDEISFSEALSFLLEKEGYSTKVAETGKEGLEAFKADSFDLVLLDLMIPEMSGIDVCRAIRTTSQVPIIMLTAKDSEIDKVVGLELGADDYVTKPYSSRELVARIKAVLRRRTNEDSDVSDNSALHDIAGIRMDIERHQVSVNGVNISLPLKEFELLEFLLRNAGRVLTRGQLIDRVWGGDYYGDTKTLDVHIKRLRSKIEVDPANPLLIQTIRGLGYKFEA